MLASIIERTVGNQARVLDIACGTGFMMLELSNIGFRTTGLEIDLNLCEITKDTASHFGLKTQSICGDACAIPLEDESFDVVRSSSFFEHVYDVDLALQEQIRVLRKGGLLIIEDGNMLNPKTLINLLIFYPIRTKGKHGGLKWLFTKTKVHRNLYGYLPLGRDEDVKTVWWWRRKLRYIKSLRPVEMITSAKYLHSRFPRVLHPFIGGCLILAEKV